MRKLALAIVLVLVLVGGGVGGWTVATVGAAIPTMSVNGHIAPGLVSITGQNWTPGAPVDLWMDSKDDAHHVAVAMPNSKGKFCTSFIVGPTALGEHLIFAVQVVNPDTKTAKASFCIKSTQQVDDRTWDVLNGIDTEVGDIQDMLDAMASQGGLTMGLDKDAALLAAGYTQLYPATGYCNMSNMSWTSMNYLAPEARQYHTAVWTGSEMLVWGGSGSSGYLNTGGRYNPATDSWAAMSTTKGDGAPDARMDHTAVWTGSEMLVWGGWNDSYLNTGGRYNPATDTWTAMSTSVAPGARAVHAAVWTGTEMLVWGGSNALNTGGRYNPVTDTWTAMSTTGAPEARFVHTAVWTGSEMLVWGGHGYSLLNTGGRYNPVTNTWTAMSTTNGNGAPEARQYHTAVWTGSEMLVWGGENAAWNYLNTGGRYNPVTNTWTDMSTTNGNGAPEARYLHTAVWTGSEILVWGGLGSSGFLDTGGRYNPATDSWTAVSTSGAPQGRWYHTAVWTGSEMLVWGGQGSSAYLNTGGRLQVEHYYYYVR